MSAVARSLVRMPASPTVRKEFPGICGKPRNFVCCTSANLPPDVTKGTQMALAKVYRFERPVRPLKARVAEVLQRSDEVLRRSIELQERLGDHGSVPSGGRMIANHIPRHVGPKLLACHDQVRRLRLIPSDTLDDGTKIGRDGPLFGQQLADELGAAADGDGQRGPGAANGIDGSLDVVVHRGPLIKQCCMVRPALHERKPPTENQAMLDKKRLPKKRNTAEVLKASLTEAFTAWARLDPRGHTKAELARKCAKMRDGMPCTPQTVSGWFATGRMDKGWIRIVEHILEARLDFDGAGLPETGTETDKVFSPISPELEAELEASGKTLEWLEALAWSALGKQRPVKPVKRTGTR